MHRREVGAGGGKYIVTQDLTPCALRVRSLLRMSTIWYGFHVRVA